ncbi:DUF2142 domain-containing protein [Nocardioides cynanchi]|uniref:DUF2142 domain-containing protein n=1 Tax=Nocardioides cynanchi TaxID=2558918 RepID=UPI001244131D|nr:DUF2142 domain-containing protein [Nocardioides cynanchi]
MTDERVRLAVRRSAWVLVAVLLAQAAWILAVPPFRGIDEFDHAYRAAGVASGQWHLTEAPVDGRGWLVWVPADLVEGARAQCEALPYTGPDNCRPVATRGDQVEIATTAGQYNPLFYWVVGTVARPFHGAAALYAMRITTALVTACLLALGAGLLSFAGAGRWAALGLVAAITPQVLFSGVLPAPNGPEMGLGLVLWSSLLALDGSAGARRERLLLATAFAAAVPLAFLRYLGPLWLVCIVISVVTLRGWASTWQLVVRRRATVVAGVVAVGAATAWGLVWMVIAGRYHVPVGAKVYEAPAQWSHAFYVPLWMMQMVGAFPFRDIPAPIWTYPLAFLVIGLLTWGAWRRGADPRRSRVLLWLVVASLVVPILLALALMPSMGAAWQGRYELPFLIGFLPLCGLLLDQAGFAPTEGGRLIAISAVLLTVVQVACVVHVEQLELQRRISAGDPSWVHPSPWVIGAIMALACGVAWYGVRTTVTSDVEAGLPVLDEAASTTG